MAASQNSTPADLAHLVPVKDRAIGDVLMPTCDLKELHAYLGVGRGFTAWIEGRIKKYGFVEGTDYIKGVFSKTGENPAGGRPETDYFGTLDMGKELAMVENNPKGREARRYFIECERRAHGMVATANAAAPLHPINADPAVAAHLAVPMEERRVRQRDADLYRKATGLPGMRWFMWNAGYPIPPKQLLGLAVQHELEMLKQSRTVTVTIKEAA